MEVIYNGNYDAYSELMKEVYKGIDKAHPDLDEYTREEYARIAIYMIKKNKTEMAIHAPKKSTDRWYRTLAALKENKKTLEEQEIAEDKIIQIEDLRKRR